ncbi:transcription factor HES-5-like [Protopterus annectens]|uniref:transcription factor HES-5-like n=1 Tax=Protopterus annectens TaxID=7888 RepID=UPI001CFB081C|nr:transcription factor HES-5-like [Protopterus annectens]
MTQNNLCVIYTGDLNSNKDNYKLRKLTAEKMRRDRINSSIEQLKGLLEKEFSKQQPNSRLEKADVLEMTVNLLRQHQQGQSKRSLRTSSHQDFREGYSRCLQETIAFASVRKPSIEAEIQVLNHIQQGQVADVPLPSLEFPSSCNLYQNRLTQDPTNPPSSPSCQYLHKKDRFNSTKALWRPW